ncbi:hypothetical protein AYO44_05305 [Planctomycetaceae bacterium SCGC AG-212-F19]|nr:hypothetical protein AYO44_05305 [Planctomycetaceae bacterium SCGC AG-212-F19]
MVFPTAAKLLLFGRPGPRRIPLGLLRGLRFSIHPAHQTQRLLGMAEREIAEPIRNWSRRSVSAVDIGAADGMYSLYFAAQVNIHRVLAFEPDVALRRVMEANFQLNRLGYRGKLQLDDHYVGTREDGRWCRLENMSSVIPLPTIIKIDVDGGELDVLRGARRLLSQKGICLVIETHSAELEVQCSTFLRDLGYRVRIVPNGWYRRILPEQRPIAHNRWLLADQPFLLDRK